MDDRQLRLRVALVTIAVVLVFFVLIGLSTPLSFSLGGAQAIVKLKVTSAAGVGRNTPVRRDGVLIGRVESTRPVRGGVLITAKVTPDNPVLVSDIARIRPSSLFGDAIIEFTQDPNGIQTPVPEDAVIEAKATPDPLAALTEMQVEVQPAIRSLGQAGDAITRLAQRLDTVMGDDFEKRRLSELIDNLNRATLAFNKTVDSVNAVIGGQPTQEKVRGALEDLPKLVADLRNATAKADATFTSLEGAIVSAETNLKSFENLTEPLGEKGEELVQLLSSSLENLDLIMADSQRFASSLNNGQGSLGRLVNERELYDSLKTTVYNANQTIIRINELAKQLRPILGDVRVISDKVAREPGRIIGGAIRPGPGLK